MSDLRRVSLARPGIAADILPLAAVRAATARALADGALVGPTAPLGHLPLRVLVAARHGLPAEQVLLVDDDAQGLALLAEHLYASSGGHAVCAAPGDPAVARILRRFGATVHVVPAGDGGLDVDALTGLIDAGLRPSLVHVAPTVHDPTGGTLGLPARERLVALAAAQRFLLYEDDARRGLAFDAPPPSLHALAGAEAVACAVDVGTALVPGAGAGALLLPRRLARPLAALAADAAGDGDRLGRAVLAELLAAGDEDDVRAAVRDGLRARRDVVVEAVRSALGARALLVPPTGGTSLWLRLPGLDADGIAERAASAGVEVAAGRPFHAAGGGEDALRLRYGAEPLAGLVLGLERLAAVVEAG